MLISSLIFHFEFQEMRLNWRNTKCNGNNTFSSTTIERCLLDDIIFVARSVIAFPWLNRRKNRKKWVTWSLSACISYLLFDLRFFLPCHSVLVSLLLLFCFVLCFFFFFFCFNKTEEVEKCNTVATLQGCKLRLKVTIFR